MERNERIIGLDIGSNSVGWAVVTMKGNELVELHGMGSRILPSNDDTRNFEQGKAQTRNADRRRYRSMRRNNHRYKLRRANLVKVLKLIGAWPEGLDERLRPSDTLLTSLELYNLRAKAVDEAISLPELGRVLYHMNQRRGYKDIGELMDELQGKEAPEEEKESNTTVEVKQVTVEEVSVEDAKGKREILRVRLADGTEGNSTQPSFKELVGKTLYLQIKTKRTGKGDTITFSRVSVSDWLKNKDELDKKIAASGKHPGQYFYQELLDSPDQPPRFRERVVLRDRYKAEFDAIWDRQTQAYPGLRDPAVRDRVMEVLIPRNQGLRAQWAHKDLKTIVRDFVIYYQRPLKSQVSNKGECRFERKLVVPVSSPVYQLFRIWQQVNNIVLRDKYMREQVLTPEQRLVAMDLLLQQGTLTEAGLLRALKLNKGGLETSLRSDLPGHVTLSKLRKLLGDHSIWPQLLQDAQQVAGMERTLLFKLWHVLYSVPEQENRKQAVQKLLDLDDEAAEALSRVRFERKHGAVSARAAARITHLMACGPTWNSNNWPSSLQQRVQQVIDQRGTEDMKAEMREKVSHLTSIEHFQGLQYWVAATVVYGDHRAKDQTKLDKPDQIRSERRGFLRNPAVEQVVNEALMVVRDIWKEFGRPDSFRIELARELRQNQQQRESAYKRIGDRERKRKAVVERLQKEFSKARPTSKDIERYELWEQQKHQCIYSGRTIEASQLFSREADVDHILPRSLFYDDSLQNKVLCLRTENTAKDNTLGALYMKGKGGSAYEDYVKRMSDWNLPYGKRKFLLAEEVPESFINRQMNETRYIGTELRKRLERIAPVNTTVGQVTDALKNEWGLTTVYKEVLLPRFERLERITGRKLIEELPRTNGAGHVDYRIQGYDKRIDHRHHALDALVVALTRQKYIQKIAQLKQRGEELTEEERAGRLTWWPLPHRELRSIVKAQLERTIPSIKNRQRLLTKASNRTAWYDAEAGVVRKGKQGKLQQGRLLAVRGKLHDEQPMGEVRRQERMPIDKVMKRLAEVSEYKEVPLMEVVQPIAKEDPAYRNRFLSHERERAWLEERLAKHNGDTKAALKDWMKHPPRKWDKKKKEEVDVMELTVLVPKYTTTVKLTAIPPKKDPTKEKILKRLNKIIDKEAKVLLHEHFIKSGEDPKGAFTTDALFELNSKRSIPVHRVRTWVDLGKTEIRVGSTKGRMQLLRKNDPNRSLHLEKGENYALIVYVDIETKERKFKVLPYFDAIASACAGQDLIPRREGHKHFILRKGDMVYVPRPDEAPRSVPWSDEQVIGERIVRLVKMTQTSENSGQFYFMHARVSTPVELENSESEYTTASGSEFEERDEPRTKISSVCIPIAVDRLGRVSPLWP